MKMKNNDLLDMFIECKADSTMENHTGNLYIIKPYLLVNYNTVIAFYHEGILYVSERKYSNTTSRHQNYLIRHGAKVMEAKAFDELAWKYKYGA